MVKSKTRQHYAFGQVKFTFIGKGIDGGILTKGRIIAADLKGNDLMKSLVHRGQTVWMKNSFTHHAYLS